MNINPSVGGIGLTIAVRNDFGYQQSKVCHKISSVSLKNVSCPIIGIFLKPFQTMVTEVILLFSSRTASSSQPSSLLNILQLFNKIKKPNSIKIINFKKNTETTNTLTSEYQKLAAKNESKRET